MKRFNFTPAQQHELKLQITDTIASILSVRFNEVDDDQLSIRRRVALQGRLDLLNELAADDYPQPDIES